MLPPLVPIWREDRFVGTLPNSWTSTWGAEAADHVQPVSEFHLSRGEHAEMKKSSMLNAHSCFPSPHSSCMSPLPAASISRGGGYQFHHRVIPFRSITERGYNQWQSGFFISWSLSARTHDMHCSVGARVQRRKLGPDLRRLVIHLRYLSEQKPVPGKAAVGSLS